MPLHRWMRVVMTPKKTLTPSPTRSPATTPVLKSSSSSKLTTSPTTSSSLSSSTTSNKPENAVDTFTQFGAEGLGLGSNSSNVTTSPTTSSSLSSTYAASTSTSIATSQVQTLASTMSSTMQAPFSFCSSNTGLFAIPDYSSRSSHSLPPLNLSSKYQTDRYRERSGRHNDDGSQLGLQDPISDQRKLAKTALGFYNPSSGSTLVIKCRGNSVKITSELEPAPNLDHASSSSSYLTGASISMSTVASLSNTTSTTTLSTISPSAVLPAATSLENADSTSTTLPPAGTSPTLSPPSTSTTLPPAGTSPTLSPAGTSLTLSPPSTSTTLSPPSTSTTLPLPGTPPPPASPEVKKDDLSVLNGGTTSVSHSRCSSCCGVLWNKTKLGGILAVVGAVAGTVAESLFKLPVSATLKGWLHRAGESQFGHAVSGMGNTALQSAFTWYNDPAKQQERLAVTVIAGTALLIITATLVCNIRNNNAGQSITH